MKYEKQIYEDFKNTININPLQQIFERLSEYDTWTFDNQLQGYKIKN